MVSHDRGVTGLTLIKSLGKFSVASILNFVIGIVAVIFLTRCFEPHVYGAWSVFITTANFLTYFFCFGFNDAFIRFSVESPFSKEKRAFITSCMIKSMQVSLLFIPFVLLFRHEFGIYLFHENNTYMLLFLFLYTFALLVVNRYMINFFRVLNDVKNYTFLQVGNNAVAKLVVFFSLLGEADVIDALCWQTIGGCSFCFLVLAVYNRRVFSIKRNKVVLNRDVYKFAAVSWFNNVLFQMGAFAISVVISSTLGLSAFGIYSSTNIFSSTIAVISNAFTAYWSVFMFKYYQEEQKKIMQMHDYMMLGCITIMQILLMLQSVAYMFLGDGYQGSREFFSFIVCASLISLLEETTQYGILIKKRLYEISWICVGYFACNIALAIILMKWYSIAGAGMALLLATCMRFALLTWRGQRYYRSIDDLGKSVVGLLILAFMAIINYCLFDTIMSYVLQTIAFVLAVMLYRNQIKLLYIKIKNR